MSKEYPDVLGGSKVGWLSYHSPLSIWQYHSSFLCYECFVIPWGFWTLWRACQSKKSARRGISNRCLFFWLAGLVYSVLTELVAIFLPEARQSWHAQGLVMLIDGLPLSILFYYCTLLFSAYIICETLPFPWYIRPLPTVVLYLAANLAFDATALRFVWYTFHDTDPTVEARINGHVVVNIVFQAGSAFFLCFLTNMLLQTQSCGARQPSRLFRVAPIACGISAFPATVLTHIIPFSHVFRDVAGLSQELGLVLMLLLYVSSIAIFVSFRSSVGNEPGTDDSEASIGRRGLLLFVMLLASLWLLIEPTKQTSVGYHEPIGPCNETAFTITPMSVKLEKKRFFCLSDKPDKRSYRVGCGFPLPADAEQRGLEWYAICGKAAIGPYDEWIMAAACASVSFLIFFIPYIGQRKEKIN